MFNYWPKLEFFNQTAKIVKDQAEDVFTGLPVESKASILH